jgi:cyclopropane fatty-acyl-phospholipid synthase-like methyltransferase
MPTSDKEGKAEIVEWCNNLSLINKIIDIGAGKGTYCRLFKKRKLFTNSEWIGVEAWQPYIDRYDLIQVYNRVINIDFRILNFSDIGNVDLVILGDVLEHVTKDEAIEFVNTISRYSRYAVISIPIIHYPQDEIEGNPFEIHIKDDWSHNEVMESFSNIEKFFIGNQIGCYLLKFR